MVVKIRERRKKNGKSALYLDKYYGSFNGEPPKRKKEVIRGVWIYTKPKNKAERDHNKEQKRFAEKIATQLQHRFNHKKHGFVSDDSQNANFIDFFLYLSESKDTKSNRENWKGAYNYLVQYAGEVVPFRQLDIEFVEGFKFFLQKKAFAKKTKKQLSINTQVSYFRKFKTSFKEALSKGYLTINYASNVKGISEEETLREYLTQEELEKLAITKTKPKILKRAFLFACLTGLRFVDIEKLTWNDVEEYKPNKFRLKFRQQKTQAIQYLTLHPQAIIQMGERKKQKERVFNGFKRDYNKLKLWTTKAGIDKNITFHSARHTHATLLMTYGVDLYIIKEILGHKHIHTTEIYTKIVNERKESAIDKLPIFKI